MALIPVTLAILSIVFLESIFSAAGVTDRAETIEHKLLSVAVLAVINGVNCASTKVSTQLNKICQYCGIGGCGACRCCHPSIKFLTLYL